MDAAGSTGGGARDDPGNADDIGSDPRTGNGRRPRSAAAGEPGADPTPDPAANGDTGGEWDRSPWDDAPWSGPTAGRATDEPGPDDPDESPGRPHGAVRPPVPQPAGPADDEPAAWPDSDPEPGGPGGPGTFDDAADEPAAAGEAHGSDGASGASGDGGRTNGNGASAQGRDGSGRYAGPPGPGRPGTASDRTSRPGASPAYGPTPRPASPAGGAQPPPHQTAPPAAGRTASGTAGASTPPAPTDPGYHPRHGAHNPFLQQSEAVPHKGMRRFVYRATFGTVNLGPSGQEQAARLRRERVQRTLHGSWRVVVMSIKGGVGKTTTAAMLGRTLAEWRGDRVVALDTNPDMGTLGDRLVGSTDMTVRGLLAHEARHPIQQVGEVNRYTSLAGRLHVLANEQDPAVSEDFSGQEYAQTLDVLERFYNVIVADCGTGVLRPWVRDMLALANTLVVVAEPKGDAATRAAGTLDWIEQHGFRDLVARSVAVINYRSPTPKSLDISALNTFFGERCRAVRAIRYDEHLDLGVQIQYDRIPDAPSEAYVSDATKEDYLELAATITDEFS